MTSSLVRRYTSNAGSAQTLFTRASAEIIAYSGRQVLLVPPGPGTRLRLFGGAVAEAAAAGTGFELCTQWLVVPYAYILPDPVDEYTVAAWLWEKDGTFAVGTVWPEGIQLANTGDSARRTHWICDVASSPDRGWLIYCRPGIHPTLSDAGTQIRVYAEALVDEVPMGVPDRISPRCVIPPLNPVLANLAVGYQQFPQPAEQRAQGPRYCELRGYFLSNEATPAVPNCLRIGGGPLYASGEYYVDEDTAITLEAFVDVKRSQAVKGLVSTWVKAGLSASAWNDGPTAGTCDSPSRAASALEFNTTPPDETQLTIHWQSRHWWRGA